MVELSKVGLLQGMFVELFSLSLKEGGENVPLQ
jgi:hypothetical protein